MEYFISATITETGLSPLLTVLDYFMSNYAAKFVDGSAIGDTFEFEFILKEATFNDAVDTITTLYTLYGSKISKLVLKPLMESA